MRTPLWWKYAFRVYQHPRTDTNPTTGYFALGKPDPSNHIGLHLPGAPCYCFLELAPKSSGGLPLAAHRGNVSCFGVSHGAIFMPLAVIFFLCSLRRARLQIFLSAVLLNPAPPVVFLPKARSYFFFHISASACFACAFAFHSLAFNPRISTSVCLACLRRRFPPVAITL